MNLILMTLALAMPAQDAPAAPAAAPSQAEQAYEVAVTCSSSHMVASVVVGQMGDTAQQADLRRLADNFQRVSIGFGQALSMDEPTVISEIAESAAARIAPLEAMANDPNRQAGMTAWATQLNQDLDVCAEFAAKLAAN